MLNFRNVMVFFFLLLAALLVTDGFLEISAWFYPGIILVLITLLAWGSMTVSSGFYMKLLCRGDRKIKSVALTFDDGPDAGYTPQVLDILKTNQVQAAFFVVGSRAENNPGLISRIHGEGHILGGHSHNHGFFFDLLPVNPMKIELKNTEEGIMKITGKKIRLFRPPYGVTNPTVARAVSNMNYTGIGWSLKSKDTVTADEKALLNKLIKRVKPGDIVLFHDNQAVTVNVLEAFIAWLRQQNFTIERLDNFLHLKAYAN
ncbi:MAG TPA: polysaccharide deacetylase family protein [Bacteroidales bacterium]|nr:polysaccharide deacetylase family protein [Bacteroidales bacterium]